jgi:modulator of FtsH protease
MNYRSFPQTAQPMSSAATLPFVRRVYTLLTAGIGFAILGAMLSLYAGSPVAVRTGDGVIAVPPLVALEMQHGIIMLILFFGAFFGAMFVRRVPVLNVAGLFGFTFVNGLVIAPTLFVVGVEAAAGNTMSASPVRDAFLLTGITFLGLTSYCFVTKKDFSFLGAALSTGIWVVIGAGILALVFHSSALSLATASVGVILFAGYILWDTSRILRAGDQSDAVGAALSLFLDVVNLFLSLLRILAASRRND